MQVTLGFFFSFSTLRLVHLIINYFSKIYYYNYIEGQFKKRARNTAVFLALLHFTLLVLTILYHLIHLDIPRVSGQETLDLAGEGCSPSRTFE